MNLVGNDSYVPTNPPLLWKESSVRNSSGPWLRPSTFWKAPINHNNVFGCFGYLNEKTSNSLISRIHSTRKPTFRPTSVFRNLRALGVDYKMTILHPLTPKIEACTLAHIHLKGRRACGLHKVHVPNPVTYLNQKRLDCVLKWDNRSKVNNQHNNYGDLRDHVMSTRIFTLVMNKLFVSAPNDLDLDVLTISHKFCVFIS